MSNEDEVMTYCKRFLDLTKPLLESCWLNDEECNTLFWYGFHFEDRAMILCRLHSKHPSQRSGVYAPLRQVFCAARAIFSQKPGDLQWERWDALERYPIPRGPYDYRCDTECRPSLSRYQAQEFVQDLEAEVTHRKQLARENEDQEIDSLMNSIYGLSPRDRSYASLYARCASQFPNIAALLPEPVPTCEPSPPVISYVLLRPQRALADSGVSDEAKRA